MFTTETPREPALKETAPKETAPKETALTPPWGVIERMDDMQEQLLNLAQALQMVTHMRDHSISTTETIALLRQMPTCQRPRKKLPPLLQERSEFTKKEVITVIYDCDGPGDDVHFQQDSPASGHGCSYMLPNL